MIRLINKYSLILIVVLAIILRFYSLDVNPPALTWDEVSWGYNAYTLGLTGKDEFGKQLPITYLESFGDFKPPIYAYLSVIPVYIFGLNEFSTRFASAFFGSLTVLISYFLVLEIFFSSKNKKTYGLLTALILAVSPWHILLSRAAFEANVATFFIVLGVFLFLYSTRGKLNALFLFSSLFSFILAMNTFNTSRVFLPLFVLFLFILRRKPLVTYWKKTALAIVPAFIISIPLLIFLLTPQAQLRYQEVNIFSDINVVKRTNQEILNDDNSIFSKVIHNRRFAYGVEYINHYLDNLNPQFLFISGDGNPKFSIRDVGQMYLWELPFIIFGAFLLFKKKEGGYLIIPVWIILGIIPAATARETPHALRIETTIPAFQILTAYCLTRTLIFIKDKVKERFKRNLIYAAFGFTVFGFFLYFTFNYLNHYPIIYASEWQYGYKDAVKYAESQKDKYKKVYFTKDLGRPYIYTLFYGKYPPETLIKNAGIEREALGFVHVNSFGKYYFEDIFPEPEEDILYLNISGKIPGGVNILKTFYLPNGEPILTAYEK